MLLQHGLVRVLVAYWYALPSTWCRRGCGKMHGVKKGTLTHTRVRFSSLPLALLIHFSQRHGFVHLLQLGISHAAKAAVVGLQ